MLIKYFIYCRKSSEAEDKQILSLPAQVKELQAIAQKENLIIVDIYQEAQSAHWIGRPKFNEMIARIEKGEANGIIVWDESRIARNAMDSGKIIYMIDLKELVEIRKPGKSYHNTPDDKSWLAMCFMMSKKESDDKGVNVARGLRTKAEKGWYPSSFTKPGYMWDRMAERGNKTLLDDPIRFPLIKQCWELMLTGAYSVPQILRILNNEWKYTTPVHKTKGGKPMKKSALYDMFADTFYYGEYLYKDKDGIMIWHRGEHTPMITKDEFDRIQILLGRNGRPRPKTHDFPLTGIIRCGECKAMITCEEKWQLICSSCKHKFASQNKDACPKCQIRIEEMVKPTIVHHIYYHCTKKVDPNCTQRSINAEELETQVDTLLGRINISDAFKDWALRYLGELNKSEVSTRNASIASIRLAYDDCLKRLDNLTKLKISPQNSDNSLLSDEEFKQEKQKLLKEKSDIEQKMANIGYRITNWLETAEKAFNFAVHARVWFADGTPQEKREIVATVGSNLLLRDKKLLFDLEKPYFFIDNMVEAEPSILHTSEPKEKVANTSELEASWAKNPHLLPEPHLTIQLDFTSVIQSFQDLRYIGEMRQRWQEIKKLNGIPQFMTN